ncbi:DNA cytosine methyltransferase [Microcoleus sp. herbarium12]|uniref:DNA cytosine methyltransferase n=1 Tax=Microcoleus sp. herbarium12 TaxID=3055437 RepID=UPI002FD617E5
MNKTQMRALSLFTGIGSFELAAAALDCFKVEQFVEIDEDAQYVLQQHYPHIPIHSDIRIFNASRGEYDCIWGGFPRATGTSNARGRTGLAHPESSLWWQILRIID